MEVVYATDENQQAAKLKITSDYIDTRTAIYGTTTGLVGMVGGENPSESISIQQVNGDFVVLGRILVKDDAGQTVGLIGKLTEG